MNILRVMLPDDVRRTLQCFGTFSRSSLNILGFESAFDPGAECRSWTGRAIVPIQIKSGVCMRVEWKWNERTNLKPQPNNLNLLARP